jgi:hypothetical protein
MSHFRYGLVTFSLLAACGGDDGPSLNDYLPAIPAATGKPQQAFAGQVTDASQLVSGPAQSGLVGDYFIKNDKVTFIVQAPTRVLGVIPQGGNVVDAVLTNGTKQIVEDHFGELGMLYRLGRTCEPTALTIVRDGSHGGVAVIEARGKSGNDDFINIKGIGVLPVPLEEDPDFDDGVTCATTYILEPGSTTLQVYHSLFNGSRDALAGPMGTIADTGGNTEGFTNARGFERADISALQTLSAPEPSDFVVYQGPGVAYGVIPRHDTPTAHTQALIAGVSVLLDGNTSFLDVFDASKYFLHLGPAKGYLQRYDLVVGRDGADVDTVFRTGTATPEKMQPVSGHVTLGGLPAAGARVGVFVDGNRNGSLDDASVDLDNDGQPDDKVISYFDVAANGSYAGQVATTAGSLLVRAEVKNVGRSPAAPVAATVDLAIPAPIVVDYQIVDDATSLPIPGRLVVIGDHPAFPDSRVFETDDRQVGVVTQLHAIRGSTVDLGDGKDPQLVLPAAGTYRIYVSRGTEWSVASQPVTATSSLTFRLRQVNPTPGYLATDWHVHQIGSPDSNVPSDERVRSAVSAGVEMFAVTDHDYVADLQPLVEQLGVQRLLRVIPGLEMTPFAYGHYQAWPIEPDDSSANHGAVDWGRGAATGDAMTPGELYAAARARGAQMLQVNHPRNTGFTEFQSAFQRANVKYDFDARTIFGDYQNASLPNEYLRLPGESLWSDQFNGLEIWNGFSMADTNGDSVRECLSTERIMWDWLSMLSLGFYVTPAGNSDTHTTVADPLGMPRTYVRVADDSADAIENGSAVDAVLAAQTGARGTARDVVLTDGPMLSVTSSGQPALGRQLASAGKPVTLSVAITSPDWAQFDTLEVFANSTPGAPPATGDMTLVPLKCYTSRPLGSLAAADPCMRAHLAPEAMTVSTISVATGFQRFEATVTVTLDAGDLDTRSGATGSDAWLVFRARGNTAIFPLLIRDVFTAGSKAALLGGDLAAIRAALTNKGPIAEAISAPVFIDFDGNGYRAPFAPR